MRPPLPTPRPRGPVHKTPACCLRPGGLLCDGQSAVFSLGEACGSCFTSSPGTAHQADVAFQLGVHMNRAEATSSVLSRSPLRRPAAAPTAGSRHGRDRARSRAPGGRHGPPSPDAGHAQPPQARRLPPGYSVFVPLPLVCLDQSLKAYLFNVSHVLKVRFADLVFYFRTSLTYYLFCVCYFGFILLLFS